MTKPATVKKKVIYCIEDDSTLLAVYAVSFSAEQYDIALFNSGPMCLECMKMVFPDLIFLDLNLPGQDGFGFLESVKRAFPNTQVPVVIVSGTSNASTVGRARDFNVTAYFAKPLTPDRISDFAEDLFALQADTETVVTKALLDCLKRQEEISFLDFEKFLRLTNIDHGKDYFSRLSRSGLVIDLGTMGVDMVSDIANFTALQKIYKNGKVANKVKVLTQNEAVFHFLNNLGRFVKSDVYDNRNAAIRNIRIDLEFGMEG